ncbi:MAG: hypothetical protein NTY07_16805 [Bacteroidia bacterium]|nr:hypothetical protein [Bacteroidia bacterium]
MNYDDKSLPFNKVIYGLLVGFISPILFFLLYYHFRFGQYSFSHYLHLLIESKKLANVMSISVLPNLAPFMLFINSSRYSSGRGVLAATIILGIFIFILKFI